MLIGENILLALSGLLANKMRALLTMLGIIIGWQIKCGPC